MTTKTSSQYVPPLLSLYFMKISKLFHWLYALIMFLPVFFWIPTAFYYAFNEHAVTNDDIVEKYETKQVYFNQQFGQPAESSYYSWNDTFITFDSYNSGTAVHIYNILGLDNHIVYLKIGRSDTFVSPGPTFQVYWQSANSNFYGVAYTTDYYYGMYSNPSGNIDLRVYDSDIIGKSMSFQFFDLTEMFGSGSEPTAEDFDTLFPNLYYAYNEGQQMTLQIPTGETITVTNNTRNMSYSWEQVWSLPIFSWTHDTFFSAPFNYIAGLFGIQAGNTLSYCLSYWFSISIIWLVFDLMIYVPLLVHRWLDKAVIQ